MNIRLIAVLVILAIASSLGACTTVTRTPEEQAAHVARKNAPCAGQGYFCKSYKPGDPALGFVLGGGSGQRGNAQAN